MGFTLVALLGTALALLFSAANVFFRDFGNIVSTLTLFVTFSVPMIYPYSMVRGAVRCGRASTTCSTRSRRRCCSTSAASGWA